MSYHEMIVLCGEVQLETSTRVLCDARKSVRLQVDTTHTGDPACEETQNERTLPVEAVSVI